MAGVGQEGGLCRHSDSSQPQVTKPIQDVSPINIHSQMLHAHVTLAVSSLIFRHSLTSPCFNLSSNGKITQKGCPAIGGAEGCSSCSYEQPGSKSHKLQNVPSGLSSLWAAARRLAALAAGGVPVLDRLRLPPVPARLSASAMPELPSADCEPRAPCGLLRWGLGSTAGGIAASSPVESGSMRSFATHWSYIQRAMPNPCRAPTAHHKMLSDRVLSDFEQTARQRTTASYGAAVVLTRELSLLEGM